MHGQKNPFEAPESVEPVLTPLPKLTEEGNLWLGVALGAVLGLWGFIGCLIFAKPLTKKGAGYGFGGRIAVSLIAVGIMFAVN